MGRFIKGVLGGFEGKIGTVIGATWRGIDYMRSLPRKSKKARTQNQLAAQIKFKLVMKFVSSISDIFMLGFDDPAEQKTGINAGLAYNLGAITGTYPDFTIDFSKVVVSQGSLFNALTPTIAALPNGDLQFTWTDNTGVAMANADDNAILVMYCPELNMGLYSTKAATRSEGTDVLKSGNFKGKDVETWISFITKDKSEIATSLYTGRVTIL